MRIVTGVLDKRQLRVGEPCGQRHLVLRWKLKVVSAGQDQRRRFNLAQSLHHRPTPKRLAEAKDERLGPNFRPQESIVSTSCQGVRWW